METFTKDQFWAELDELGEDEVQTRVLTKRYTDGNHKLSLAREWLAKRERDRQEAREAERMAFAKAEAEAASRAAIAAERSAAAAEQALAISKGADHKSNLGLVISGIAALAAVAAVIVQLLRS
jgi:hypothetical protein